LLNAHDLNSKPVRICPQTVFLSRNVAEEMVFSMLWQRETCFKGNPLLGELFRA
jgi:hypothetical protein